MSKYIELYLHRLWKNFFFKMEHIFDFLCWWCSFSTCYVINSSDSYFLELSENDVKWYSFDNCTNLAVFLITGQCCKPVNMCRRATIHKQELTKLHYFSSTWYTAYVCLFFGCWSHSGWPARLYSGVYGVYIRWVSGEHLWISGPLFNDFNYHRLHGHFSKFQVFIFQQLF